MTRYAKGRSDGGFTLIELLIVIAIIGIIAAIAIPNLLRARVSANESQVIGDTRTVMSATVTYAASNCGFFPPTLQCMTREGGSTICIPNYPPTAPQFLAGDLARATPYAKSGYQRNYFTVGAAPPVDSNVCDPASVLDYCYSSAPQQVGLTGVRSFAGSSAGAIWAMNDGTLIPCPIPSSAQPLE